MDLNLSFLEDVLVQHLLPSLTCITLRNLGLTCKHLNKLCKDERLWKCKFILNFHHNTLNVTLDARLFEHCSTKRLIDPTVIRSYYSIYQLLIKRQLMVIELEVKIAEQVRSPPSLQDVIEFDQNFDGRYDDINKYTTHNWKVDETCRLLLTKKHLTGLGSLIHLYRKYNYSIGNLTQIRWREIRSWDEKDKDMRMWQQRAMLKEKEHNDQCEKYTLYMQEYHCNGITQKLADISGKSLYPVPAYHGTTHPLPDWNFGFGIGYSPTKEFEYLEASPNMEDEFGNVGTARQTWLDCMRINMLVFSQYLNRLPLQHEDERDLSYILRSFYSNSMKEFVIIIRSPNEKIWFALASNNFYVLSGIKLASKILKAEWIQSLMQVNVKRLNLVE